MSDLKKEFDYYMANQHDLVDKYNGKVVIIHHQAVQGAYANELEATLEGRKKFKPGDFLVQRVVAGTDSFTQTFYSRVASA